MTLEKTPLPSTKHRAMKRAQQLGLASLICSGLLTPSGSQTGILSLITSNSAFAQEVKKGELEKLEKDPSTTKPTPSPKEFTAGFEDLPKNKPVVQDSKPLITKPIAFGVLGVTTVAAAIWCKLNIQACKAGVQSVKSKLLDLTNRASVDMDEINRIATGNLDIDWDALRAFDPKISPKAPADKIAKAVENFNAQQKAYKADMQKFKNLVESSQFRSRVEVLDGFELDTSLHGLTKEIKKAAKRLKSDGVFGVFGKPGSGKSHHIEAMAKRAAKTADPDRPIYVRLNNNTFDQSEDAKYVSVIKTRFTDVFKLADDNPDKNIIFVVDDYKYLDTISIGDGQTLLPAFEEIVKSKNYKIILTGKQNEASAASKSFGLNTNSILKKSEPNWANKKDKHLSKEAANILSDFFANKAPEDSRFINFSDQTALKTFYKKSDTYFNNLTEPGRTLYAAKEILTAHSTRISELCAAKELCGEIDTLKELGKNVKNLESLLVDHQKVFDAEAIQATRSKLAVTTKQMNEIKATLKSQGINVDMTARDLDEAFIKALGFNRKLLSESTRRTEFDKLELELAENVIGQPHVIKQVRNNLQTAYKNFANGHLEGVGSVNFFSGQSGVGKTYLAKMMNKFLLGGSDDIDKLASVTVTDGMHTSDFLKALVESIKDNPNSVILIDEIDKSSNITNAMNEILNDGIIRFNGDFIDIRTKHMIINSNAGFQNTGAHSIAPYSYNRFKDAISKAAEDYLRGGRTKKLAEAYHEAIYAAEKAGRDYIRDFFGDAYKTRVNFLFFRPIDIDGRAFLANKKITQRYEQLASSSDALLLENVTLKPLRSDVLDDIALFTFYDEASGSVRYYDNVFPPKFDAAIEEAAEVIELVKQWYGKVEINLHAEIVKTGEIKDLEVKVLVDVPMNSRKDIHPDLHKYLSKPQLALPGTAEKALP